MDTIRRFALYGMIGILVLVVAVVAQPSTALAGGKPARSEILTAGPYVVEVDLSESPPIVGQAFDVTVIAQHHEPLSGRITALPGLGTDGIAAHVSLTPGTTGPNVLEGSLRLSVKGAWHLVFDLNGSRGPGTTSIDVTVAAPNAMPPWLGWLIGLSPLIGCAWLIWQQRQYRRTLLEKGKVQPPEEAIL